MLVLVAGAFVYQIFFFKIPYCDSDNETTKNLHCDYQHAKDAKGKECLPCPAFAECHARKMICKEGYENSVVSANLCLKKDDDPFIKKLVSFLYNADSAIQKGETFKKFSAEHD